MLDRSELVAGTPLWAQIADRLRRSIVDNTFPPGALLPGEVELNRHFGVSRSTSRAALDRLQKEGLIVRRAGRGSIVVEPHIERPLNRLSSFSEDMKDRGLEASYDTRGVRMIAASPSVAAELAVERGSPILAIERMMLADGIPLATSTTCLVPSVLDRCALPTKRELDAISLYRWLAQTAGIELRGGRERIEAAIADPATTRALGLAPPAAILVSRRTSWSQPKKPIEHVVMKYRADRYSFHVEIGR